MLAISKSASPFYRNDCCNQNPNTVPRPFIENHPQQQEANIAGMDAGGTTAGCRSATEARKLSRSQFD